MKVLIDTNIILDALMNREPWASAAQELLRNAAMEKFTACMIASQTTDIFYILRRQGIDARMAKDILKKLTVSIHIADVTPTDVSNALDSEMPDFEDALLAYCGKRCKTEYIITRNEKDFQYSPVPSLSPQGFLAR